jgi:hypothetical protein
VFGRFLDRFWLDMAQYTSRIDYLSFSSRFTLRGKPRLPSSAAARSSPFRFGPARFNERSTEGASSAAREQCLRARARACVCVCLRAFA